MKEVSQLLGRLLVSAFKLAKKHPFAVISFLAIFAVILSLPGFLRPLTTREITFLTGPQGGSGQVRFERINDYLKSNASVFGNWGRRYSLTNEPTDGFEANRIRINQDTEGLTIGFGHDGFATAGNVRTLLPLSESYLHVVVRRKYYDDVQKRTLFPALGWPTEPERTFESIAKYLRDHPDEGSRQRWYLGPPNSGTRQLAIEVLNFYGIDANRVEKPGTSHWNWSDMSDFLVGPGGQPEIDVAFCTTSLGTSPVIQEIAKTNECSLVGFRNHEGLRAGRGFLLDRVIPKSAYSGTFGFCSTDLHTIGTTRVLICSTHMSDTDAFLLAQAAREALRDELPEIQWTRTAEAQTASEELVFYLHPGAELFRAGRQPRWIGSLQSYWLILILPLLLAALSETAEAINKNWARRGRKTEPPEEDLETPTAATPEPTEPLAPAQEAESSLVERIGEVIADAGTSADQYREAVRLAREGLRATELSETTRMAYLDIVAKVARTHDEALEAVCALIRDKGSPTSLRLEAIGRLPEVGLTSESVLRTLSEAKRSKSLRDEAARVEELLTTAAAGDDQRT